MGLLPVGINNRIVEWRAKDKIVNVFLNDASGSVTSIADLSAYFYAKKFPISSSADLDISIGYYSKDLDKKMFCFHLYPFITDISIGDYLYEILITDTAGLRITIVQDRFSLLQTVFEGYTAGNSINPSTYSFTNYDSSMILTIEGRTEEWNLYTPDWITASRTSGTYGTYEVVLTANSDVSVPYADVSIVFNNETMVMDTSYGYYNLSLDSWWKFENNLLDSSSGTYNLEASVGYAYPPIPTDYYYYDVASVDSSCIFLINDKGAVIQNIVLSTNNTTNLYNREPGWSNSVWFKAPHLPVSYRGGAMVFSNHGNGEVGIDIGIDSDGKVFARRIEVWGGDWWWGWTSDSSVVGDDTWHNIIHTYNSITKVSKVYLDGALTYTADPVTDYLITGFDSTYLGAEWIDQGFIIRNGFWGYLDEVKIFGYPLPASQVSQIYNQGI